jgi:hypothetical protein
LQAFMGLAEDPETYVFNWIAEGHIWLGVDQRLPRTPAVFERKTAWRMHHTERPAEAVWAHNYTSAAERPEVLRAQFDEDVTEYMMIKVRASEAAAEYGGKLAGACRARSLRRWTPTTTEWCTTVPSKYSSTPP